MSEDILKDYKVTFYFHGVKRVITLKSTTATQLAVDVSNILKRVGHFVPNGYATAIFPHQLQFIDVEEET